MRACREQAAALGLKLKLVEVFCHCTVGRTFVNTADDRIDFREVCGSMVGGSVASCSRPWTIKPFSRFFKIVRVDLPFAFSSGVVLGDDLLNLSCVCRTGSQKKRLHWSEGV